jgi:thioesterase domain-containing protein
MLRDPIFADSQLALDQAYKDYEWIGYDGDIDLILAGPFQVRPWIKVMEEQWKTVVSGKVNVKIIEGDHTTLFEEPVVASLAKAVSECLDRT